MSEKKWMSFASSIPDLSTLELHQPEHHNFWADYILEHSKRLSAVTLSNLDQSEGSKETPFNR